jgi:predicted nucleotidyltransferase
VRPSEALQSKRQEVRELVGRFRTANPRVFGSVLHGVDSETSDLDILVDTDYAVRSGWVAGRIARPARRPRGCSDTIRAFEELSG